MTACDRCGKAGARPCETSEAILGAPVRLCDGCDVEAHAEVRRALVDVRGASSRAPA